jgi:DNA-binding transcriptional ArsR family regulator
MTVALSHDQVALLAAVAHRERTPAELAAALKDRPGEIDRQLRALRKLAVVEARMDVCPLCKHVFGGRIYSATEQGLLLLAESPLLRRTAIA